MYNIGLKHEKEILFTESMGIIGLLLCFKTDFWNMNVSIKSPSCNNRKLVETVTNVFILTFIYLTL